MIALEMSLATAWLAVVIAVLGTVAYAGGIALQHHSVGPASTGVGWRQFLGLLKHPRWLGGLALIGVSAACHATALVFAPITLVQPIGILAIVWSVLIEARMGHRPDCQAIGAVIAAVLGLSTFVVLATLHTASAETAVGSRVLMTVVPIVALAAALGVLGHRGPRRVATMAWAASAAVLYGVATGFIKIGLTALGGADRWTNPWLYISIAALVIIYPGAAWIVTQSFAAGRASVAVGTMTTVDPIVAVVFGLAALGEGVGIGPLQAVGMLVSAAVAVGAVMVLSVSKHAVISPDATAKDAANVAA